MREREGEREKKKMRGKIAKEIECLITVLIASHRPLAFSRKRLEERKKSGREREREGVRERERKRDNYSIQI